MKQILSIQNTNRIRVYSNKTKKYYATKLAVMASGENFGDLEVVHDNGFWDKVDWTKEPTESFISLLHARCHQLRQKYSYLILYYSGGSDSDTVLQSFISSGVRLDEVVINRISFNDKDAPLKDIELAIQKLKQYSKLIPDTRITINNVKENIISEFADNQQWIDTPFNGTIGMLRRFTVDDFSEYDEGMLIRRGSTAHIFGDLKPVIGYRNNKWYSWLTNWGTATNLIGEWFYTSTDLPSLHLKQVHMAKNYFTKNKIFPASAGGFSDQDYSLINGKTIRQHMEASCRLLFDQSWQPNKMTGLGNDVLTHDANEDSLVYQHLKRYAPELFHKYIYGVVIPVIAEGRRKQIISNNLDVHKIKSRQYCLSNVE